MIPLFLTCTILKSLVSILCLEYSQVYCSQKCAGSDFNKEKSAWILRYWEFSVLTKYFSNSSRPMREIYCPLLDGVSKVGQEPSGERLLRGSFNWGDTGLPFKCSPRKAEVKTLDTLTKKDLHFYTLSSFRVSSFQFWQREKCQKL